MAGMKNLLLSLALGVTLLGCTKKTDPVAPTTDPLLGRWYSTSVRNVDYDASGKVTKDATTQQASQLDVTATTFTFTTTVNGRTSTETDAYTRSGELLTLTPPSGNTGGETVYTRGLTSSAFTLEFNGKRTAGQSYYVQSIPYTR